MNRKTSFPHKIREVENVWLTLAARLWLLIYRFAANESRRSASQSFMIDWRVTPILFAS